MLTTGKHLHGLERFIAVVVSCSLGLLSITPASGAMKVTLSGSQETPQIVFACAQIRKAAESAKEAPMEGMTPLQVVESLQGHADKTLGLVAELRPIQGDNKELRLMLGDCEAMAHLGNYYAEKILGATDLAIFDQSGKAEQQASAVRHLQAALGHWKKYAAVATSQYKPQKLGRVGHVDLNQMTTKVEEDIAIAKSWSKGTVTSDGEGTQAERGFRL